MTSSLFIAREPDYSSSRNVIRGENVLLEVFIMESSSLGGDKSTLPTYGTYRIHAHYHTYLSTLVSSTVTTKVGPTVVRGPSL